MSDHGLMEIAYASSVAEIVAALDRLVASDVQTVHACTSLAVGAELGETTHFIIIGREEWAALVLAIRKAETNLEIARA